MRRSILLALCVLFCFSAQAGQGEAVELLLDSAARHVEQAEYDQAAGALERALRIEPADAEIWHLLGQVRLHQGEYAQAEAMAQKSNSFSANQMELRQRNQHLINVARELSGQRVSSTQVAAVEPDAQTYSDEEPAPIATATQPTWITTSHEPPPPIALLPPPPPVELAATSRDVAYESDRQSVNLIYDPEDDRDDREYQDTRRENVQRGFVPIVTSPRNQGLFRLDILLRDLQRYRDQRAAFRVKNKPEKYYKKQKNKRKKGKKRRKSRDRD